MAEFRVIDPRGKIVATKNFANAEAAHAWFMESMPSVAELGWRMEVDDEGKWASFDDTAGFTAPFSRRPARRRQISC
jgi:hypothetical protein